MKNPVKYGLLVAMCISVAGLSAPNALATQKKGYQSQQVKIGSKSPLAKGANYQTRVAILNDSGETLDVYYREPDVADYVYDGYILFSQFGDYYRNITVELNGRYAATLRDDECLIANYDGSLEIHSYDYCQDANIKLKQKKK